MRHSTQRALNEGYGSSGYISSPDVLKRELEHILTGPLEQYRTAFADHDIGLKILPELTLDDLHKMGILSVGHQKLVIHRIYYAERERHSSGAALTNRQALQQKKHSNSFFRVFWRAFLSGDFVYVENTSRNDAQGLNSQVATVSGFIWFAAIAWATELSATFDMAEDVYITPEVTSGEIREWGEPLCFGAFLVCVVFSFFGAVIAIHNNMLLSHVSDMHFGSFMEHAGKRAQKAMVLFFFFGLFSLILGFVPLTFMTVPWPANAGICSLGLLVCMPMYVGVMMDSTRVLYSVGHYYGARDTSEMHAAMAREKMGREEDEDGYYHLR
jgi:hypothetical protein